MERFNDERRQTVSGFVSEHGAIGRHVCAGTVRDAGLLAMRHAGSAQHSLQAVSSDVYI